MKTKIMCVLLMLLALAAFSLTIIPTGANAADINSATIDRIGYYPNISASSSGAIVFLTDNSATPAWTGSRMFYVSSDMGNAGLATLLTAFSNGNTVWVRIGGSSTATPTAGSLINIVYINK